MEIRASDLTEELQEYSLGRGADLLGLAELAPGRDFIASQNPPWVLKFPVAVSLVLRLNDFIVDGHSPDEPRQLSVYLCHVYEVVSRRLDFLAYDVARWLTDNGHRAFPIPASPLYDSQKLVGTFSHKLAAHLAGLGWIGKSCLLLTDRFGPRIRFASVLTDAALRAGKTLDRPCGKCRVCVDSCPVGAFTGAEFSPDQGRIAF